MADLSEESKRVSVQVAALSTQLIESVDKQSRLEDQLNDARRTILKQKETIDVLEKEVNEVKELRFTIAQKTELIKKIEKDISKETSLRLKAEEESLKLGREVEDLTASLFDEANIMVADARKEKDVVEIQNARLIEQLRERDSLLETLNLQLRELKLVLQNLEDDDKTTTTGHYLENNNESVQQIGSHYSYSPNRPKSVLELKRSQKLLYSPCLEDVRFDLSLFEEFLKFIALLPTSKTLKSTYSGSKLVKRLINDELSPVLKIDNAPGLGWLVKKTFWNSMLEGLVVTEPLSGVNDMYPMGHAKTNEDEKPSNTDERDPLKGTMPRMFNFPLNSPPIAVREDCATCGESRDDVIEHARMYVLKTLTRDESGSTSVSNVYPLCHWCLIKVRQACEILAFLRSLKTGAWNLEKVTMANITKGSWMRNLLDDDKRHSQPENDSSGLNLINSVGLSSLDNITKSKTEIMTSRDNFDYTNIHRAWLHLCQLRSTLNWAHIGIWKTGSPYHATITPSLSKIPDSTSEESIRKYRSELESKANSSVNEQKSDSFEFEDDNQESNNSFKSVRGISAEADSVLLQKNQNSLEDNNRNAEDTIIPDESELIVAENASSVREIGIDEIITEQSQNHVSASNHTQHLTHESTRNIDEVDSSKPNPRECDSFQLNIEKDEQEKDPNLRNGSETGTES